MTQDVERTPPRFLNEENNPHDLDPFQEEILRHLGNCNYQMRPLDAIVFTATGDVNVIGTILVASRCARGREGVLVFAKRPAIAFFFAEEGRDKRTVNHRYSFCLLFSIPRLIY